MGWEDPLEKGKGYPLQYSGWRILWTVSSMELQRLVLYMGWARVGKEFPDMRQNEREIKFIRMGDAVRPVGRLERELTLNRGP